MSILFVLRRMLFIKCPSLEEAARPSFRGTLASSSLVFRQQSAGNSSVTSPSSVEESDEENSSNHDSDSSCQHDSDSSDSSDGQVPDKKACKYYNSGGCRDHQNCSYLHVCKYHLKGNCRYGSKCKLSHGDARKKKSPRATANDPKLTDGRYYQWQLGNKSGWSDIENDHILEAQYSLPHSKSIKIYNTKFGAVSIDFNRMSVYKKDLSVRRLDDGKTVWNWFCILKRKWIKYADKDSKGNPTSARSVDIEKKFQSNPTSSYTFNLGTNTFEIKFPEMKQVSSKGKRKVTRRPLYRHPQALAGVIAPLQALHLGTKPVWQFQGDSGAWHEFKNTDGSSGASSDEIEKKYNQDPTGSMGIKVKGSSYDLDFRAMIQVNVKTKRTRALRRVLV